MHKFKLSKKLVTLVIALFIYFFAGINQSNKITRTKLNKFLAPTKILSSISSTQLVKVKRVIDGDTIEIESGQKVRYIGIDTPELHDPRKSVQCFAKESMEKNKQLVEGKNVKLEKDVSETDKYGRLLRYVFIDQTGTTSALFVNEYLVREGFAYAATFPPDVKYVNLFLKAQQEARENRKGLWNKCSLF